MRVNNVVSRRRAGQMALGGYLPFPSSTVIEFLGLAGFDFVMFDGEHGPFTPQDFDDLCRFADMAGLTPMARVPDISDSTVLRVLDRGVMGIMGPHITTGDKARQLAGACRFVPRGRRSFGSGRGAYFGDFPSAPEYMEHTNANVLVIAQLEDVEVLDHIDDILSVDGIDLFASGAQDIAQSLGLPGQPTHPKVKDFEARVRKKVHAAGKKMFDEVATIARVSDILLDSLKGFVQTHRSP